MNSGYVSKHYDAMLIAFGAINISEHRPKPEQAAGQARALADAFVAELVKMDLEHEAEEAALEREMGGDLNHENADRDTEPPVAPLAGISQDAISEAWQVEPDSARRTAEKEQDARLAAQQVETLVHDASHPKEDLDETPPVL